MRLIKGAWRAGYRGFACIVAVAWDTGFAPVDARTLTLGDIRGDQTDWWFFIKRGKTGEAAIGTPRIRHLIHAYVYSLDIELIDDFADLRRSIFGKDEKRRLMDMRRSGAVVSMAGGASSDANQTRLFNGSRQIALADLPAGQKGHCWWCGPSAPNWAPEAPNGTEGGQNVETGKGEKLKLPRGGDH